MKTLIKLLKNKGLKVEKNKGYLKVSNCKSLIFLDQNCDGELLNVFSLKKDNSEIDGMIIPQENQGVITGEIFPVIKENHFDEVSSRVFNLLTSEAS